MGEAKNTKAGFDPRGEVYRIDDIPAELVEWCKANPDRFVSVRDADGKARKVAYCKCARYPMREDGTRYVVYDYKWLMADGRGVIELTLSIADALDPVGAAAARSRMWKREELKRRHRERKRAAELD